MKKRLRRVSILLVPITAAGLGASYFFSNTPVLGTKQPRFSVEQQLGGWRVWIKTSPCSGRFEWLAVAKDNQPPEGGGRSTYVPYETIVAAPPGVKACKDPNPMTGCTFDEANTLMEALRPGDAFVDFCCRDYSVWDDNRSTEKDSMSVFLIRSGTPGLGWELMTTELCCEEAEAIAKKPGACSGPGNMNGNKTGADVKAVATPTPANVIAPNAPTTTPTTTKTGIFGIWRGTGRMGTTEWSITFNLYKDPSGNPTVEYRGVDYNRLSGNPAHDVVVRGNTITWQFDSDTGLQEITFTVNPDGKTGSGTYIEYRTGRGDRNGSYVGFTKN